MLNIKIHKEFIINHKYFMLYSILIIFLSVFLHPETSNEFEVTVPFYKKIRFIQFILTGSAISLYYFVFLRKNKCSIKYNIFYENNKFYCDLMYFSALAILLSTIHFLNWEIVAYETTNKRALNDIVHRSVKIWEVGAYVITVAYTIWLWYISKKGTKIRRDIQKTKPDFAFLLVGPAIGLLVIIVVIHACITFLNPNDFFKEFGLLITLLLINLTYIIFVKITKEVIETTNKIEISFSEKEQKNRSNINTEFKLGLKYIERPTLIIFGIMFAYALYCTGVGAIEEMEIFFSGAIAFELLLSSISWANTESV